MSEAGNDKLLKKEMVLNVFAIDIIPGVPEVIATIIKDFVETAPIPASSSIANSLQSLSSAPYMQSRSGLINNVEIDDMIIASNTISSHSSSTALVPHGSNISSNNSSINKNYGVSQYEKIHMNIVFNQPKKLLQLLFEYVDGSDVIALLLTKETFLRPHTIVLLDYAIRKAKPIVTVVVEGEGYIDDLIVDTMSSIDSKLSKMQRDFIENQTDRPLQSVAKTIMNEFAYISPVKYNFRDSRIVKHAYLLEIQSEILSKPSTKKKIPRSHGDLNERVHSSSLDGSILTSNTASDKNENPNKDNDRSKNKNKNNEPENDDYDRGNSSRYEPQRKKQRNLKQKNTNNNRDNGREKNLHTPRSQIHVEPSDIKSPSNSDEESEIESLPSQQQLSKTQRILKYSASTSTNDSSEQNESIPLEKEPNKEDETEEIIAKPAYSAQILLDKLKESIKKQDLTECKSVCDMILGLTHGDYDDKILGDCLTIGKPWVVTYLSIVLKQVPAYDIKLSHTCLRILHDISRLQSVRKMIYEFVPTIVHSIGYYAGDLQYAKYGVEVISILSVDETVHKDLIDNGVIDILACVILKNMRGNKKILEDALNSLWNLTLSLENHDIFIEKDIPEIVVDILANRWNESELQLPATGIVANLLNNKPDSKGIFIDFKIVEHLANLLEEYNEHPRIIKNVCVVLWNLITIDQNVAEAFIEYKIEKVLQIILDEYLHDGELVQLSCGILWLMLRNRKISLDPMKYELGMKALNVLESFSESASIQYSVCSILRRLFKPSYFQGPLATRGYIIRLYQPIEETKNGVFELFLKQLQVNAQTPDVFSILCEVIWRYIDTGLSKYTIDPRVKKWILLRIVKSEFLSGVLDILNRIQSDDVLRIIEKTAKHLQNLKDLEFDIIFAKNTYESNTKFIKALVSVATDQSYGNVALKRIALQILNKIVFCIVTFQIRFMGKNFSIEQERLINYICDSTILVDILKFLESKDKTDSEIQSIGYRLVCVILSLTKNTEKKISFIQGGHADKLISCMQSCIDNQDLQIAAFRALWSLSSVDKHFISKDEVLVVAMNALKNSSSSPHLIYHPLSLILELIDSNHDDDQLSLQVRSKLKQLDLFATIAKIMKTNPKEGQLQYLSCMILQHYVSLTENIHELFLNSDIVTILLDIMAVHVRNEKLMNIAARLLWNTVYCINEERSKFSSTQVIQEQNQESSVMDLTMDDIQDLAGANEIHPPLNHLDNLESSSHVNESIGNDPLSTQWMLVWKQICLRVVDLMTSNKTNVILQEILFGLVKSLIYHNKTMVLNYLMNCGIIDILMKSMKTYSVSGVIQYNCCVLLWALTLKNRERTEEVLKKDTVLCVLTAIKNHPKDVDIQKQSCSFFWSLGNQENGTQIRQYLIYLGVVETIILICMEKHVDDAETQANAMGALKYILMDDASRARALDKIKMAVKAIINAMTMHKESPEVQHYGCGVLRCILMPIQVNAEAVALQPPYHDEADNEAIAKALLFALQFHAGNIGVLKNAAVAISKLGAASSNLNGIRQAIIDQKVNEILTNLIEGTETDEKSKKMLKGLMKTLFP